MTVIKEFELFSEVSFFLSGSGTILDLLIML